MTGFWWTLSRLAAAGGAALIGHMQAGIGTVLRALSAILSERLSVKDFGAVLDGITDDTNAFKAAVAAAIVAGMALSFPAGAALITDTAITVTASYNPISIYGVPNRSILINQAGAGKPAVVFSDAWWWTIDGVNIAGRAGFPNDGIKVTGTTPAPRSIFWSIKNCTISPNGTGIHLTDCNQGRIERVHYHPSSNPVAATYDAGNLLHGVLADGGEVDDITIRDCTILNLENIATGGAGIKWACAGQTNAIRIIDNELELAASATYRAIWLNNVYGATISGNYLDNSGVLITASYRVTVENNRGAGTCDLRFGDGTAGGAVVYGTVRNSTFNSFADDSYCDSCTYENVTTVNNWGASNCIDANTRNCSDQVTGKLVAPKISTETQSGNFFVVASHDYDNIPAAGTMTATLNFKSAYFIAAVEIDVVGLNVAGAGACFASAKHTVRVFNGAIATDNAPWADMLSGATLAISSIASQLVLTVTNTSGNAIGAGFTVRVAGGAKDAVAGARGVGPIVFT